MTKEGIMEFKEFMELNGAWGEFVREFYRPQGYTWRFSLRYIGNHSLLGFLRGAKKPLCLNCAFRWDITEAGEKYWGHLHNEWIYKMIPEKGKDERR